MLEKFRLHIEQELRLRPDRRYLLAFSGGLDSTVLLHLWQMLGWPIALAHCNFRLRGSESDADQEFVEQLSRKSGLPLHLKTFDTEDYARQHKVSIQMAARSLRYSWFEALASLGEFDHILTAHHADDNLETVLINFMRGTGLEGLLGIPAQENQLVRPLLPFSRQELEQYAMDQGLTWREDSSNASLKYLRNHLRHEIIPRLKDINPLLLKNFQTTLDNLRDSQQLIDDARRKMQKKMTQVEEDLIKISIKKLKKKSHPKAYLYQLLKDYGFTAWNDVADLLEGQSGKMVLSPTHRLVRDRRFLLLSPRASRQEQEIIFILKYDQRVQTPLGTLSFEPVEDIGAPAQGTIYVDADQLQYPLKIAKPAVGDFFRPIGMVGKKKLSKFFKDQKFSIIEKEESLVLYSGADVVWIIGHRADDRFKITEETTSILKIKLHQ